MKRALDSHVILRLIVFISMLSLPSNSFFPPLNYVFNLWLLMASVALCWASVTLNWTQLLSVPVCVRVWERERERERGEIDPCCVGQACREQITKSVKKNRPKGRKKIKTNRVKIIGSVILLYSRIPAGCEEKKHVLIVLCIW